MGGSTSKIPLETVKQVSVKDKFMGKWYVIGNMPTYFERGAENAVEIYTWNEQKDRIDIDFRFTKDGKAKNIPQKGWIHDESGAEWRVSPFWPLKLPYLIIELADDYSHTVIGYPSREYVWIMGRESTMSEETYNGLVQRLQDVHGYDTSKILKIKHTDSE